MKLQQLKNAGQMFVAGILSWLSQLFGFSDNPRKNGGSVTNRVSSKLSDQQVQFALAKIEQDKRDHPDNYPNLSMRFTN